MADNTELNTGSGGDIIASDDITGVKFQRIKVIHGADGVNDGDVSTANPFPVQTRDSAGNAIGSIFSAGIYNQAVAMGATNYVASTNNSTTAQLASSATFVGVVETAFNQQSFSILITSDQNGTLTIKQYIDAGGTKIASSNSYSVIASLPFARSGVINGNYISITFQNTGGSTTTTLQIDTAYGTIPAATQLNNGPVAINEISGSALNLGQTTMAASLPVAFASNQTVLPVNTPVALATGNITTQNLVPAGTATVASAVEDTITTQGLALVQVTGTYTGALSLQYTVDGSTWVTSNDASFYNTNSGIYSSTITSAATGIFRVPTAGAVKIRITGLAAVTGTATVTINASSSVWAFQTNQNINQNLVGGATITVNRGVSGSGTQRNIAATDITYRASTIIPLVAAVTVNVPFFNVIGSATKTVVIKRISVSGMTQTAVGYYAINVEKLSTASTSGTSTTLVATPLDASDAAATAVVKAYTVAPTKGTLIGTLRSWRALWQATTAVAGGPTTDYDFDFGDIPGANGITLRGVAQEIALTFPVVLASAGTLSVNVEWIEY